MILGSLPTVTGAKNRNLSQPNIGSFRNAEHALAMPQSLGAYFGLLFGRLNNAFVLFYEGVSSFQTIPHRLPLSTGYQNLHKDGGQGKHSKNAAHKSRGIIWMSDPITGSDKQGGGEDREQRNADEQPPSWVPPLWVLVLVLALSGIGWLICLWGTFNFFGHRENNNYRNTKKP